MTEERTQYISASETAAITGLTSRTIQAECGKGTIPGAVRIGRQWCIPREWAEAHRAEDYGATHIPLSAAASIARITRQGLIDKVKSGEVKGFAQPLMTRKRWWVERKAFFIWLRSWMEEHRDGKGLLPVEPMMSERELYTFEDYCVDREILTRNCSSNDLLVMWDIYGNQYKDYCRTEGYEWENL